ncbi:MAG TPA: hypothetical protein VJ815_00945 [Acidimicrobiia bacterium]|nr:hypothetical protein [Acidimicrobiia bacterium]
MRRPQSDLAESEVTVVFSAGFVEPSDLEPSGLAPLLSLDEPPFSEEAFAFARESVT